MKRKLAVLLSVVALVVASCNASVVQAYINLAVSIAIQVANLAGAPKSASDKVAADLAIANSLAADFRNAETAAKPGILAKIDASLTQAQTDIGDILTLASVKDPNVIRDVRAGLAIAITAIETVRSIEDSQSASKTATAARTIARVALPGSIAPSSTRLSANDLKRAYNTTMAAHPEARIK